MPIVIFPLSFIVIILSVTGGLSNGTCLALYPPLSTSLISVSPIGIDILLYFNIGGLVWPKFNRK